MWVDKQKMLLWQDWIAGRDKSKDLRIAGRDKSKDLRVTWQDYQSEWRDPVRSSQTRVTISVWLNRITEVTDEIRFGALKQE